MATIIGTIAVKLDALTAQFERKMKKVNSVIEEHQQGITAIGGAATVAFGAAAISVAKWVNAASDANEQINLLEVGFGKNLTPAIQEWAKTTADAVGRSQIDMKEMAGTLQAMLVPMTGNVEAAAGMSTQLATLAVDLGSFFNVSDPEALIALKAALVGSTEPMRRFGVVMTQATLDAFAMSKGIRKSVADMTEAEKVALRYEFILSKTQLAQGDAARTSESLANMIKRIQGQFKDLAVALGTALLPTAEKLAGVISSVLQFFLELSPETQRFIAIGVAVAGALAGVVAAMSGIALLLPTLTAGFVTMGAAVSAAFGPVTVIVAALAAGILATIVAVGALKKAWDANMGGIQEKTKAVVDFHVQGFKDLVSAVKTAGTFMAKVFLKVSQVIVDSFVLAVNTAIGLLNKLLQANQKVLNALARTKLGKALGLGEGMAFQIGEIEGIDVGQAIKKAVDAIGDGAVKMKDGLIELAKTGKDVFVDGIKDVLDSMRGAAEEAPPGPPLGIPEVPPLGEIIKPKIQKAAEETSNALSTALLGAGQQILQSTGEIGSIIAANLAKLASGDVMGALIGAITGFAMQSKAFQKVIGTIGKVLEMVFKAFEPLIAAVAPVIDVLARMFGVFFKLWMTINFIQPIIEVLTAVLKAVADFLNWVLGGIASVWNWILDVLASIVGIFSDKAAKWLRKQKIVMDRGDQATDEVVKDVDTKAGEFGDGIDNATDSMGGFADTVDEVNSSLSNVPEGFKVALARFESILLGPGSLEFAGAPGMGLAGITINNLNVNANNVDELLGELQSEAEWQNVSDGSSIITPGARQQTGNLGTGSRGNQ